MLGLIDDEAGRKLLKHDCSKDVQILTNTIGYDYIGHNSRILLIHNKDASSKWFPIQGLDVPLAAVQVLLVLRFEDGGVETRERRKLTRDSRKPQGSISREFACQFGCHDVIKPITLCPYLEFRATGLNRH